ncbi:MAG: hypothetical protein DI551_02380 [Micavibrio aeruginosavorus]|uniref:Uncharacterized protein n=1 Tax=Micavibrio aeruginosavorus TaxID=349221 RepID=A0A2W5N3K9_9BACT|nr:MAG: hypothetical protein DI551_02380 [Micavibrio aeruginosavorus]
MINLAKSFLHATFPHEFPREKIQLEKPIPKWDCELFFSYAFYNARDVENCPRGTIIYAFNASKTGQRFYYDEESIEKILNDYSKGRYAYPDPLQKMLGLDEKDIAKFETSRSRTEDYRDNVDFNVFSFKMAHKRVNEERFPVNYRNAMNLYLYEKFYAFRPRSPQA